MRPKHTHATKDATKSLHFSFLYSKWWQKCKDSLKAIEKKKDNLEILFTKCFSWFNRNIWHEWEPIIVALSYLESYMHPKHKKNSSYRDFWFFCYIFLLQIAILVFPLLLMLFRAKQVVMGIFSFSQFSKTFMQHFS